MKDTGFKSVSQKNLQIWCKCYRIETSYFIDMKTVSHLVLHIIMLSFKIL